MTEEVKDEGVLVDAEGNVVDTRPAKEEPEAKEDDTPIKAEDDNHEDEGEQEGETEEEAEARRERNRQRRAENKNRRKEYVESLKREIAARDEILHQQATRLDALERRTQSADMATVETELRKAVDAYNYFKGQHAEAVTQANGKLATDAFEKMQTAMDRAKQLDNIRRAGQRQQQPQPQPLDPRLKMQAEQWLERNNWYDPNGSDMDSRVALTVDQELHREGWNPTTEQYWEELDARLKKYLPHRYNSGYNKSQRTGETRPRAPVAGSGRESSVTTSGGYKLSAERVQALKDAGLWDDPKQRADAIKRFKQYDQNEGAR